METRHTDPRVHCQAVVDQLHHEHTFTVRVTGLPPHDTKRVYAIVAKSDNDAAQEGIRRFVDEMGCLE